MIHFLRAIGCLLFLLSSAAYAQTDDWTLTQRDKDTIGIVEVRIGVSGSELSRVAPERGTGTIISGSGYLLTAGHLFSDEAYAVCTKANGAPPAKVCQISFLWRGDRASTFDLTIAGQREPDRDYILLKLPAAGDRIGRPNWPVATLARATVDGEPIYAVGYRGSDPAAVGGANTIDTARGSLRADMAENCSNSFGIARNALVQTSPGLSGGPTFNRLHRIIGIVLGESCAREGTDSLQDAPRSRILLVQDMPRLCSNPGFSCFFGYDGDLDPAPASAPSPWYKRLVGGEAVADNYVYGIKIRELSKLSNLIGICSQMMSDAQLVQTVQADAEAGGELAVVFDTIWSVCKPGANPIESLPNRQRLQRLAQAGYEPAQYLAAQIAIFELAPKLATRRTPEDPLLIAASDRTSLERAQAYLTSAAANAWTAASISLFELCRTRVFSCDVRNMQRYLEEAMSDGQRDALRSSGLLHLIGNDPVSARRIGYVLPQDKDRALALFIQAATPQAGATRNPSILFYDNLAAGYLAYFNWGGHYRGRALLPLNPALAQQYTMGCNGGGTAPPPLFEFCGMINAVGTFNAMNDHTSRQASWSFIQQFTSWALIAGPLARNLASWSKDGSDVDRIECPLNDDLAFAAPTSRPQVQPRTAYCYFPNVPAP